MDSKFMHSEYIVKKKSKTSFCFDRARRLKRSIEHYGAINSNKFNDENRFNSTDKSQSATNKIAACDKQNKTNINRCGQREEITNNFYLNERGILQNHCKNIDENANEKD